ncbi:uncharacterized protein PFL1_03967 [Pseudozyma flocculosa PF-1]|uniref:Endonuclease III homolog n=2 Tax=Pseudozyma flocculosa TaxID=84751 RepID=A0A5C3EWI7_9BASI|nr:uncharacterized protein PFL1_03967 [Pseudozyma flocculosa PF-1]EPQ28664.1 hypothetical protein PFL1_03967 [Pseudozyma flocculosa PF-1]SPO36613.1 related to orotidine 5`-phosphate decarboxylase [Pseudozyma flocculosa]
MSSITQQTYASRAARQPNAAARQLLECIERKQSNLCVSVDVTNKRDLLDVCDAVGPDVCLIKTHIDIVSDFDMDLVEQLTALSKKHDFLIFEDRKFADIGNTVSLQYSSGVHRIASWSHITNAHLVPGPGIITGLASVGQPLGRGCLLLAEMSSAGALTKGSYTQACVEAAKNDTTGFVCGFIAMSRVDEADGQPNTAKDLVILTPGVGLDVKGDAMGQQYRTPDQVIRESGCDVIIVGRGVYGSLMTPEGKQDKQAAIAKVREQGRRYKQAGWNAYLARLPGSLSSSSTVREAMAGKRKDVEGQRDAPRRSVRRKLFAPEPPATVDGPSQGDLSQDQALAAQLAAEDGARYSLRRRTTLDAGPSRRAATRSTAAAVEAASPASSDSGSEDDYVDPAATTAPLSSPRCKSRSPTKSAPPSKGTASPSKGKSRAASTASTASPSKGKAKATPTASPFDISPRKKAKPIKIDLSDSEAHPAPPRWQETYALLAKQRSRIVAPVDTMGCEENGREDRRADTWRERESDEDEAKRKRLATLVSLMLSSQTKDPVTAEAVYNLQRTLPGGLTLSSLLAASDETISGCIAKVGFWRRKTGYLKSAARILTDDFGGDVPTDIDQLLTLPGVGPKMAFLALSSMGIQIGIGVDTHVHRLTNRLGWHKTSTPEQTRLNLQSWLPKELHPKINKLLVGFGQVICVPVGPRCDLCNVGKAGLCPSYRPVDAKSALKRVKVDLLASDDESTQRGEGDDNWALPASLAVKGEDVETEAEAKVKVELEPNGADVFHGIGTAAAAAALKTEPEQPQPDEVKLEQDEVERALEW